MLGLQRQILSTEVVGFCFPGKIKIQDILACSFLDDLLEVKYLFNLSHFLIFLSPMFLLYANVIKCHKFIRFLHYQQGDKDQKTWFLKGQT